MLTEAEFFLFDGGQEFVAIRQYNCLFRQDQGRMALGDKKFCREIALFGNEDLMHKKRSSLKGTPACDYDLKLGY